MGTRIFAKLVVLAAVLIAIATATLDFAVQRSWEASLHHPAAVGAPGAAPDQGDVGSLRRALITGSAVALLLATLLAAVAARSIARRLQRIIQAVERLASGELATRITDASPDEIGQLATAIDRTAARLQEMFRGAEHSRNQFETLLNSIEDGVLAVSSEGRVLWVSRAMGRLLPHVRMRESLPEMIRDPEVLHAVQNVRITGAASHARAGSIAPGRVFQCTAAPLPGGDVVVVLHDLTDAERVERTRRDFIANVSHELRTPLTSIEGFTETLLESGAATDSESREFLEVIRRNTLRMSRLTEDLLTLARVESGEWQLEKGSVPAGSLLEEAATGLQYVAGEHSLQVRETVEAQVLADRDAIHQVFSNLVENAAKYSAGDTPIFLGATANAEEVEFYVKDQGPGIAAAHVPRLFERFYRVDKARSREAGGTGLGLAIVKHIIMNHQGRVRVETAVGHGSTFFFTLPRSDGA
ncbi:MAG: HAMP domain-containing protein [Acidobacteria bacterium]|nr:HAMP domain-containing protein [Acidobacteriota bacterium]